MDKVSVTRPPGGAELLPHPAILTLGLREVLVLLSLALAPWAFPSPGWTWFPVGTAAGLPEVGWSLSIS
jgi:hypothetical protein